MNSAPVTVTDPAALCAWLQMNDAFYPTGAYSHSHGLEGLIEAGSVRDRTTLREYCLVSLLPSLARLELPLVRHAYDALGAADWAKLGGLCELSSALRATREARQASEAIGRQRIALLVSLRTCPMAAEFERRAGEASWPRPAAIAAALEARSVGVPLESAFASVLYGASSSAVSAAMKLLRLGQNGGQTLLAEMLALAPGVFTEALQVGIDEIGWFNPWLDIASARHEHAAARLFIS
ncbi:urease accessory protein UreF [Nibricoccus sp. IMCC34717]|uniref:urease accessory protein UreF n=1 Tax=Nibricoccus sp. IMCC34717 TaxID=3034021 RepID=UPI00384A8B62